MTLPPTLSVQSVQNGALAPAAAGSPARITVSNPIASKGAATVLVTLQVAATATPKTRAEFITTASFFDITTNQKRSTIRVL
jgi:hypothetical protein